MGRDHPLATGVRLSYRRTMVGVCFSRRHRNGDCLVDRQLPGNNDGVRESGGKLKVGIKAIVRFSLTKPLSSHPPVYTSYLPVAR